MRCYILFSLIISYSICFGQQFTNIDLNGIVGISNIPTFWFPVPDTDPVSSAAGPIQATPDVADINGPSLTAGINGNPHSGSTFLCGLHGASFHEGIMQTVTGFTPGTSYQINFCQTVVKQSNALDTSGSWIVYFDTALIGISTIQTSQLIFNSNNLVWEQESMIFTATNTSHTIKFLPHDDDSNPAFGTDLDGSLRMGIDSIFIGLGDTCNAYLDLGNDTSLCLGETILLDATVPNGSYFWQDNSTNATFQVSSSGTYNVIASFNACTVFDTITIDFLPLPVFALGDDTSICNGQSIDLDAGNTGNGYDYLWSTNETQQIISVSTDGSYAVTVSNQSCETIDSIEIMVEDPPTPFSIGSDTILCEPESMTLQVDSLGNNSILWSNGSTANNIFINGGNGNYWAVVSNDCGSENDSIAIEGCTCSLLYPNSFSPNQDGLNDFFNPIVYGSVKCEVENYRLTIYNRWGEQIFVSTDQTTGWDGLFENKEMPIGAYTYYCEYKTNNESVTRHIEGSVNLFR